MAESAARAVRKCAGFVFDYVLTFAAEMDMSTVKVILALAAMWGGLARSMVS